jgi:hypothetical protein
MSIIKPIKTIKVQDFVEFCQVFDIKSDLVGGDDGFDIELIENELNKRLSEKWFIVFVDNKNGGYFLLHLFD